MTVDANFTDPWALGQWPYMRSKLVAVGATPEQVDDFMDQWLHDSSWDHADKLRLLALGDGKLRGEVMTAAADALRDTETEADELGRLERQHALEANQARRAEAERMWGFDPPAIIAWVGSNVDRAATMLALEELHPKPRVRLVGALRKIVYEAV